MVSRNVILGIGVALGIILIVTLILWCPSCGKVSEKNDLSKETPSSQKEDESRRRSRTSESP